MKSFCACAQFYLVVSQSSRIAYVPRSVHRHRHHRRRRRRRRRRRHYHFETCMTNSALRDVCNQS